MTKRKRLIRILETILQDYYYDYYEDNGECRDCGWWLQEPDEDNVQAHHSRECDVTFLQGLLTGLKTGRLSIRKNRRRG